MDNETYNKIQEEIKRIQEQLHQIARDVNGNFEEGQKPFGIILMNGDNEGCTTQVLSTPKIAALMIIQLLSNRPEIAQEIKRIQALQNLERLESFLNAMLPDDKDDDQSNTQATFSVRLVDVRNDGIGGSKLHVVKFLKESKDISLKEALDLVNTMPSIIFNNLSLAEAERMVNKLAKFGAICKIVEDKKTKVVICEK